MQKGYAFDFWLGKELYFADYSQEIELKFKVKPHRNALAPKREYPLGVLVKDNLLRIVLPAGFGQVEVKEETLFLQSLSDNQSYIWESGKWRPCELSDSLYLGQKTYKFVF